MAAPTSAARQHGLALAVVLILLLIMTLLGLASMRGTLLQERMGASIKDRSLAFQATEAALRQGELDARALPNPPAVIECRPALAPTPCPPIPAAGAWAAAKTVTTLKLGTAADEVNTAQPQYLVELLADDVVDPAGCPTAIDANAVNCSVTWRHYRITARSQQADRATVMLQSIFRTR